MSEPKRGGEAASREREGQAADPVWLWGAALLRVPLTYKIVLANVALILVAVALCAAVAVHMLNVQNTSRVVALFAVSGVVAVAATLPLHLAIIRMALVPVAGLDDAAERVKAGDLTARVAASPLADPALLRIAAAFNRLLDAVSAERDRLRAVASRAFRAQEAERQRLALELQEEWAQRLAGVLLQLRVSRSAADSSTREERVEVIRSEIQAVLSALRQYARGLHPPALRELGLAAALRSYTRTLDASLPVGLAEIEVDAQDVFSVLSSDQELALYRIAQEALANALHHAAAEHVKIQLRRDDDAVELVIADDGAGFDVQAVEATGSAVGLFGIRERALYADGEAEIRSAPGSGTIVIARVAASRAIPTLASTPGPGVFHETAPGY